MWSFFQYQEDHVPRQHLLLHQLIEIFRPYLKLFYTSILSFDYQKKIKAEELLEIMLFRFIHHFPSFGRKQIKISQTKIKSETDSIFQNDKIKIKKEYVFNMDFPPFFSPKKNNWFLRSHLGLMKNENIHELLKDDIYNIKYYDLERDRIPISLNKKNINENNILNVPDVSNNMIRENNIGENTVDVNESRSESGSEQYSDEEEDIVYLLIY